ncbi:MAG: hypothetical protein LBV27_08835 [Oscillospiraceae bacterium]|nr:hypothetical protein [Oscillospiraceae bacterium]
MKVIKILLGIYIGFVVACVGLGILGALLGMTFGVIGFIFSLIRKILFNPVVIVLLALYLLYRWQTRGQVN